MANNWSIYASWRCPCGLLHFLKYTLYIHYILYYIILYHIYIILFVANNWWICVSWIYWYWTYSVNNWRILDNLMMSLRPSDPLGKVNFLGYTFVLYIHCQQLWNMCQLNIYWIYIGYTLPTIGRYMTVGWCWGMCIFWNSLVSFILQISPIYSPDIPKLFPKHHPDIPMITPWILQHRQAVLIITVPVKCMFMWKVLYKGFKNTMTLMMSLWPMRMVHR